MQISKILPVNINQKIPNFNIKSENIAADENAEQKNAEKSAAYPYLNNLIFFGVNKKTDDFDKKYEREISFLREVYDDYYFKIIKRYIGPDNNEREKNLNFILNQTRDEEDFFIICEQLQGKKSIQKSNDSHVVNTLKKDKSFLNNEDIDEKIDNVLDKVNLSKRKKVKLSEEDFNEIKKAFKTIVSPNIMYYRVKGSLNKYGITEDDYLKGIGELFKSYYSLYRNPENYVNSVLNKKESDSLLIASGKDHDRIEINNFLRDKLDVILRFLKYTDRDVFNNMMDKRLDKFGRELDLMHKLTNKNYEIYSKMIGKNIPEGYNNKPKRLSYMTTTQKIQMSKIIQNYQNMNEDTSILLLYLNNFLNDPNCRKNNPQSCIKTYEKDVIIPAEEKNLKNVLYELGFNDEEIKKISPKKRSINRDYIDVLIQRLKNKNRSSFHEIKNNEQLKDILRIALLGNFFEYIQDTNNLVGRINEKTKEAFISEGLNYRKWLGRGIDKKEYGNKKYTIKLWDRNPLEDIFLGNKTTCCTALNDTQGDEIITYLRNTAFNIIEIKDEENKVVGMVRIFMARDIDKNVVKDNNGLLLVADSVMFNNTFVNKNTVAEKKRIRNYIIDYMNYFTNQIAPDKTIPIYFSDKYSRIDISDLVQKQMHLEFLGSVSKNSVYLNTYGAARDCKKIQNEAIVLRDSSKFKSKTEMEDEIDWFD